MVLSSPPIQRGRSLHEQTYQTLRNSILAGDLVSGDRLVETQLAQQLQVSRTPIREALRQLQREGLIVADSGGGLRVTAISAADAAQLYDCRTALEQLAIVGACTHASLDQIRQLEQYVTQAEALVDEEASAATAARLLDLDYQFHHLIAESSGNTWLVFLLDQVFDKMALLRLQTTRRNPQVLNIRLEHRQIFEAIVQRNAIEATGAIQSHLTASKARVTKEIQLL